MLMKISYWLKSFISFSIENYSFQFHFILDFTLIFHLHIRIRISISYLDSIWKSHSDFKSFHSRFLYLKIHFGVKMYIDLSVLPLLVHAISHTIFKCKHIWKIVANACGKMSDACSLFQWQYEAQRFICHILI